jgi:hypothetical protein
MLADGGLVETMSSSACRPRGHRNGQLKPGFDTFSKAAATEQAQPGKD